MGHSWSAAWQQILAHKLWHPAGNYYIFPLPRRAHPASHCSVTGALEQPLKRLPAPPIMGLPPQKILLRFYTAHCMLGHDFQRLVRCSGDTSPIKLILHSYGGPNPQRYLGSYLALKSMQVKNLNTFEDWGLWASIHWCKVLPVMGDTTAVQGAEILPSQ